MRWLESVPRCGMRKNPIVDGVERPPLTEAQYAVVQALLEAGPKGLSGDKLVGKSGRSGAVNVLKGLARHAGWEAVILLAGAPGRGYRVG